MCSSPIKDKFKNINNLIEKIRDIFKCQICFTIKDEDSMFLYWTCQHFFCSDCLGTDLPCPICCNKGENQVKLMENENIIDIFRSLKKYESIFELVEVEENKSNISENVKEVDVTPKSRGRKKRSNMETRLINDNNVNNCKQQKRSLNVTKRNYKGETPLHLACRKANMTLMQELIDAGANPNLQDNAGWTPLHDSVFFGKVEVIKFLLENGACVNTPGHQNTTALHQAVMNKNNEVIRLLLKYGADKTARDIYGETPMDLVKKYNIADVEKIMITTPVRFQSKSRMLDSSFTHQADAVLYGLNLDESESSVMEEFVTKFHYKTTDKLLLTTSNHIIITSITEPKITWALISGVLMGCHVINVKWMTDSIASNAVESIEKYEMNDGAYRGYAKYRKNQIDQLPGLFSGCHFYFGGNFDQYKTRSVTFAKAELKILVERNGGVTLTRNPDPESLALEKTIPYHASTNNSLSRTSYYIIYSREQWDPFPKYNMIHMKTLPVEWLLASIHKFDLIDPAVDQSYMDYV